MFFFFSSRRRHTRYWRDWSSDVCSSDLDQLGLAREVAVDRAGGQPRLAHDVPHRRGVEPLAGETAQRCPHDLLPAVLQVVGSHAGHARLEEHTSELQSRQYFVCRLLLEKKKRTHAYYD